MSTYSYELQVSESSDGVVRTVAGRAGGLGRVEEVSGRVALAGHRRLVHWKRPHTCKKYITIFFLPFPVLTNIEIGQVLFMISLKFK